MRLLKVGPTKKHDQGTQQNRSKTKKRLHGIMHLLLGTWNPYLELGSLLEASLGICLKLLKQNPHVEQCNLHLGLLLGALPWGPGTSSKLHTKHETSETYLELWNFLEPLLGNHHGAQTQEPCNVSCQLCLVLHSSLRCVRCRTLVVRGPVRAPDPAADFSHQHHA